MIVFKTLGKMSEDGESGHSQLSFGCRSQSIAPFKFTLFHLQRARPGPRLPPSDIKCPAKYVKCLIPFKQNTHYYHHYMDKENELREVKNLPEITQLARRL